MALLAIFHAAIAGFMLFFMAVVPQLGIAAGFAVNVFGLTPRINIYRDRDLEGDAAARRMFGLLHMASVAVFLAQLAGSLAVAGMFVWT